jgi:hypothetical protein
MMPVGSAHFDEIELPKIRTELVERNLRGIAERGNYFPRMNERSYAGAFRVAISRKCCPKIPMPEVIVDEVVRRYFHLEEKRVSAKHLKIDCRLAVFENVECKVRERARIARAIVGTIYEAHETQLRAVEGGVRRRTFTACLIARHGNVAR